MRGGAHVGDKMMGMYSSARKFGLVTLWEVRDMHEQATKGGRAHPLTSSVTQLPPLNSTLFLEDD